MPVNKLRNWKLTAAPGGIINHWRANKFKSVCFVVTLRVFQNIVMPLWLQQKRSRNVRYALNWKTKEKNENAFAL